jgi:hypothetical protein
MVVVGDVLAVITVAAGLPAMAVHVPVPVAAIVAVLPGHTVWSGPALGLGVTVTIIESDPETGQPA